MTGKVHMEWVVLPVMYAICSICGVITFWPRDAWPLVNALSSSALYFLQMQGTVGVTSKAEIAEWIVLASSLDCRHSPHVKAPSDLVDEVRRENLDAESGVDLWEPSDRKSRHRNVRAR